MALSLDDCHHPAQRLKSFLSWIRCYGASEQTGLLAGDATPLFTALWPYTDTRATCNLPLATCDLPPATCNLPLAIRHPSQLRYILNTKLKMLCHIFATTLRYAKVALIKAHHNHSNTQSSYTIKNLGAAPAMLCT